MADRYDRESRLDRIKQRIRTYFPERQLMLRAEGRVRYLRLPGSVQMVMMAMLVTVGGWATFTSFNYALHDQILSSKENQISETRRAYRSLLEEVTAYQSKFNAVTLDLESNHGLMLGLVEQNAALQQNLRTVEGELQVTERDRRKIVTTREHLKSNLVDLRTRLRSLATKNFTLQEDLTSSEEDLEIALNERDLARDEGLRLEEHRNRLEDRLTKLQEMEQESVQQLTERTMTYIETMERVVKVSGLNVQKVLAANQGISIGQGGPFIEAKVERDDLPAAELKGNLISLEQRLHRTSVLQSVMRKLPLAAPMDTYYITSAYGKRRDPVNKRWAMHYGLDLGGPYKSQVFATAPGTVRFAGWKNKYGKVVEIDHGAGISTRFGHLNEFFVKKGQKVEFHDKIGLLGNTGRSTGAHLHYEVAFHKKTLNPLKFIKAGRHVFQE